jgi:hypothetical protein
MSAPALAKVQKYVIEQALCVTHYFAAGMIAYNGKVHDFRYGLLERPNFGEVWLSA